MGIGERLKKIRKLLKITAKEMAESLNIPLRTIGGYERNENPPNERFFKLLIEKYNININWLLTGEGTVFIQRDEDIISILISTLKISENDAIKISKLLKNEITRDLCVKFLNAKNGDISSIESLMQILTGIKLAFL